MALAFLIAAPATSAWAAKKKKDEDSSEEDKPAALTAPEPDAMGRVHFGPQGGEGLGRVNVKGASSDSVQVFLDGRYFGRAPIVIHSVPKGDYIVEGRYPDGKQVSRPVSVSENEEAAVELGAGRIAAAGGAKSEGMFAGDISPERLRLTKIFLIAGAASLAFGITFGVLEMRSESDWEKATDQAMRDNIASDGKRNATLANVGFILTGACLVGAAVAGYPMLIKPSAEKSSTTMTFVPAAGRDMTGGSLVVRF